MTDLATTQLQHLLDQATTGPWEAKDSDCITSEHGEVLWNTDQAVDWNRNDHDVNLAAHAPELAGEVLWMRKQLASMRKAWLSVADDPKRMVAERTLANHAVQNTDYILGETNE